MTNILSRQNQSTVLRRAGTAGLAALLALSTSHAAFAAIDNTATANGTAARGTYTPVTDSESVPVAPSNPAVTIIKTVDSVTVANGTDGSAIDGGDIITYRYLIENTGNVTLTNVEPVDGGPTFNGTGGTNSLSGYTFDAVASTASSAASVAPGETAVFTATYTLSTLDWLRGSQVDDGVDNSATGTSAETPASNTSSIEYNIPANPLLTIDKTYTFTTDNGTAGQADVGDVIEYTYTVTNTGNVAINDVTISDDHELPAAHGFTITSDASWNETEDTPDTLGINDDTVSGTDGSWDILGPGGVITFTYSHTVTQAEFDAQ